MQGKSSCIVERGCRLYFRADGRTPISGNNLPAIWKALCEQVLKTPLPPEADVPLLHPTSWG